MADHAVGARDESNESEASQALILLMLCSDNAFSRTILLRCRFGPFVSPSLCVLVFQNTTATEWSLPQQRKCSFFQFYRSPLRGNQRDGGKEFTIAEGTVQVQVGIDLRKCVSGRI